MTRELAGVLVIGVLVLALGLMALSWRLRRRRQAGLVEMEGVPAQLGDIRRTETVLYLSTTPAGAPTERIAVRGLGFRARCELTVADSGLVLGLAGEPDRFIPAAALTGVGRATWTIDRSVETDGLVVVGWTLGGTSLESNFRPEDPAALVAAIEPLVPLAPSPSAPAPTPKEAA